MQVKFFPTFVQSQYFYPNQGHSDLRKIAVFRRAFATEFNELKKNVFLNNVCKVIKLGLCLEIMLIHNNRLVFQASELFVPLQEQWFKMG